MRKIIFILIILCGAVFIMLSCSRADNEPKTALTMYYADARLNRLLPYEDEITDADAEHMAKSAVEKLIAGRDDNDSIRRLIPKERGCVSVYVNENIAYVNLKSSIADKLPDSRDIEQLVIYQLVNTLTNIKGIRFVRFTVDGEVHKDFMGYFDMRETYKFKYPE